MRSGPISPPRGDAPTDDDVRALPKVELHVHLEGTITATTASALAERHGEDPEAVLPLVDGAYPGRFRSFDQFVDLYLAVSRQIRAPEDLRTVAEAFARQQADQNVRYSEVTFTAKTHVDNGMDPEAMWAALREGFAAVPETRVGIVVDAVRNLGPEHGHATIALVEKADAPIVGLGLAGIETSVPAGQFRMLRAAADALGLGLAVHAGETGPASSVWDAVRHLGADRIGHGVAAASDPQLLGWLREHGTVLEVCPTSNVILGIFPDHDAHPLPRLLEAGVAVTVNSDDPPYFGTTLTDELRHAVRMASLDVAGLADLQRTAAAAAFTDAEHAAGIVAEIDAWERERA